MQNEIRKALDSEELSLYSQIVPSSVGCDLCPDSDTKVEETGRVEAEEGKKQVWVCKSINDPYPITHPMAYRRNSSPENYDSFKAHGWSEIVVESRNHAEKFSSMSTEQIKNILTLYQKRVVELEKRENVELVCIEKNNFDTDFNHPYSRIFSLPIVPKVMQDKVKAFLDTMYKTGECFYCNMAKNEKLSSRVIFENEEFMCFVPFSQRLSHEVWLIPKRHYKSLTELTDLALFLLSDSIKNLLGRMAVSLKPFTYNIFYYQKPVKEKDFHLHIVFSQKTMHSPLEEGYGVYMHRLLPEDVSKMLRGQ